MNALDTPGPRPGVEAALGDDPDTVVLTDQFRLGGPIQMSRAAFDVIRLFDGQRTLEQIQRETAVMFEGEMVELATLRNLVEGLDQELFLHSPRLVERLHLPDRPSMCLGNDPEAIRKQLKRVFTAHGGPGLPGTPGSRLAVAGPVRAVLLPHMDYGRGGITYGWGLKELVERTDARLFVIVGTSHYSGNRFSLTRQNFVTPFGRVETDQSFVDRIEAEFGDGLFDDPFAHVSEHSIELEVAAMQFAFGDRPFRIVPLLVGSLVDCVRQKSRPGDQPDIARLIAALRVAEASAGEPVCYVISGDLAHIGPKFDDEDLVAEDQLTHSRAQDHLILDRAVLADPDGYFNVIAAEADARRICGLPPTYVVLEAAKPQRGKLLHYGRFVHPDGYESVSFASMAFEPTQAPVSDGGVAYHSSGSSRR